MTTRHCFALDLKDDPKLIEKYKNQNDIKPVKSSLDKIETQMTQQINSNKYLSKSKYKQKMNQKPEVDEFLPKSTSTGKYLSREDFKNKLKKK